MNKVYEINRDIIVTDVQTLVNKGKLTLIKGLGTICSCGKAMKLHGSRYNKNSKKFETFCPNHRILVDKDFEIITSFPTETFNLIFSEREE